LDSVSVNRTFTERLLLDWAYMKFIPSGQNENNTKIQNEKQPKKPNKNQTQASFQARRPQQETK